MYSLHRVYIGFFTLR